MSAPHLFAATRLMLPAGLKLTALALGDLAQPDGRVIASHRRLRAWTQHSEQTVRRTLRELAARQLLDVLVAVDPRSSTPPTLGLRYPGASLVGGAGATQVGVGGATQAETQVPGWHPNDPILLSDRIKAAPQTAPAHPVEKGHQTEEPTAAQLTKLVAVIIDDPHTQLEERGELEDLVKRACARGGFRYDTRVVDAAIRRVLAARGLNPDARDLRHAGRRR
jgi:hypothetical protein